MSIKHKTLIAIIIVLNITLIILCIIGIKEKQISNETQTYKLGVATQPGYIGVIIKYDIEPVDIALITPEGKKLTSEYVDVYDIDTENKTITVLKDSDELGSWKVSFNKKSNEVISYSFVNKPSPTLYMTDIKLVKIEDYYYLSFTPYMDTDTDTECNCSVMLSSINHGFVLDVTTVSVNETAYVLFNPNIHAYNGEQYTVKVALQTLDETQSTNKSINLTLEDGRSYMTQQSEIN